MKNIEDDLPLDAEAPIELSTDEQLNQIITDADETYRASAMVQNMSAASQALNTKLRAVSVKAEREAQREKRAGLLEGVSPTSPMSEWPPELAAFWLAWADDLLLRIKPQKSMR